MDFPHLAKSMAVRQALAVGMIALITLTSGCGGGESSTVVTSEDAATATDDSEMNILSGNITIEGAYELSHIPSSRVVVQLEDVTKADSPSVLIAEQAYENVTTLPLSYELELTGKLALENRYSVAASVFDDSSGELNFWTDSIFPVSPGDTTVDFHIVSVYVSPP